MNIGMENECWNRRLELSQCFRMNLNVKVASTLYMDMANIHMSDLNIVIPDFTLTNTMSRCSTNYPLPALLL